MTTTKIDRRGTAQSVQLPDGFQLDVDEVEILRRGGKVILRKKRTNLVSITWRCWRSSACPILYGGETLVSSIQSLLTKVDKGPIRTV